MKYGIDWAEIAGAPAIEKESKLALKSSPSAPVVTYDLDQTYYFRNGVDCYCTDKALDLARSYLEGCYDDYIFFQDEAYSSDDATYVLLIGDIDYVSGSFQLHEVREIYFKFHSSVIRYDSNGSGSLNFPVLVDGNTTPAHSSRAFNFSYDAADISSTLSLYYGDVKDSSILYHNDSDLLYSSFEGFPHLIEGVQNYAYAGFLVCGAVVAVSLADRLFRRLH